MLPPGAARCASALRPELSAGFLHHVVLLGLDRGQIVAGDYDRGAFVARLGDLAAATGTS